MNIEQIKEKTGLTSEQLFGITKQPEQQCPQIDEVIRGFKAMNQTVNGRCKDLYSLDVDGVDSIARDIEWDVDLDLEAQMEALRRQVEQLRSWGQGWKDTAKYVLEQHNKEYWPNDNPIEYLIDEKYLK